MNIKFKCRKCGKPTGPTLQQLIAYQFAHQFFLYIIEPFGCGWTCDCGTANLIFGIPQTWRDFANQVVEEINKLIETKLNEAEKQ